MALPLDPQIEIHSPGPLHWSRCTEPVDWAIIFEAGAWLAVDRSRRWPLPARRGATGRCHVWIGWQGGDVLPDDVAAVLGRICRQLRAAYQTSHPHLHSQRGPLRSPVGAEGRLPSGAWHGQHPTYLAGEVASLRPADCPPWELPPAYWDALGGR